MAIETTSRCPQEHEAKGFPTETSWTVTLANVQALGAVGAGNVTLAAFPANRIPFMAMLELDTALSGGGSTAVTVEIGDAGDTDGALLAANVFTGVAAGVLNALPGIEAHMHVEPAWAPVARVTVTGANCNALTTGQFKVRVWHFPAPPAVD